MPYTLLRGSFVIRYPDLPRQGPEPDGDTIKFRPDTPAVVEALPRRSGVPPDINARGISARLEAIDTMEHQLAARGGGVDRLLQAPEPDPALSQPSDRIHQMPQRPTQPIELPNNQAVARAELIQDLLEDRAVAADAAGGLGEHPVAAGTLQRVDLELWLLVGDGDAGIAEQVTHGRSVAEPCDRAGRATLISDTGSGRVKGP
jgi:hypothetical protein